MALESSVTSKIASTIGQLTASVVRIEPVRFCAIMQPRMAWAARKAERGSCRVTPCILKMIPAIIGPSRSAAGRCKARKPIERRSDRTHNIPHCSTGIRHSLFNLPLVYRYSIKKAGPGKNNSNQGKGENQQFSERDALSGCKGHHGKSVIVNFKKHHCIEGPSLDGGTCNGRKFSCIGFFVDQHVAGEIGVFSIFIEGIRRGVFIQQT